jgi:uncharacterized protein
VAKSFRRISLALFIWLSICLLPALSQDIPPSPQRWATDKAGFLSPQTLSELDGLLESFEMRTGRQVILYVDKTTGLVPIEDWAVRVFEEWEVGRRGEDDGLALFIMSEDRRMRIEVGYGLEGVVPDAIASRIISEILVPRFQEGDPDTGVREALVRLLGVIEGEPGTEEFSEEIREEDDDVSLFDIIILGFLALCFLYILITNPVLAIRLLFVIMSGGGGGGGSGGRGGFSGGGGRSGGGGASGSW